jgi:hypothetical protein
MACLGGYVSSDSDCALDGKAMTEYRKYRHNVWYRWNMRKLVRAADGRFSVANDGECIMFREPNKPKIDFYPSTGRYRVGNKTRGGHFNEFWKWYLGASI